MSATNKTRYNNRNSNNNSHFPGQFIPTIIKVISFLVAISIGLAAGLYEKHNNESLENAPATIENKIKRYDTKKLIGDEIEDYDICGYITHINPISSPDFDISNIPPYSSDSCVEVNNNIPFFAGEDIAKAYKSFEYYSPLDDLGRCGLAVASIGVDLMPTEQRDDIGMIKPSGWHTVRYDNLIDGKYLYNRCHLIGYQLCGENSNIENLITGTRELNIGGMLPFEDMIANYVQSTGNHVLYRVIPIFEGDNLLATGVLMEGYSVEDNGHDIRFNVFCYNSQPGISIDYSDGSSHIINNQEMQRPKYDNLIPRQMAESTQSNEQTYILNKNTKRFHYRWCASVDDMTDKNKTETVESRENLIMQGYLPCGNCHP